MKKRTRLDRAQDMDTLVRECTEREYANAFASPEACMKHLKPYAKEGREHFVALYTDARRCIIGEPYVIAIGSLSACIVHPREVFREGILRSAAALIVSHNHPSGNPNPSPEDLALTRRLRQAGELIGIELLDHIITGGDLYVSLRAKGEI